MFAYHCVMMERMTKEGVDLGAALRRIRTHRGLSRDTFASRVNYSPEYLRQCEGQVLPRGKMVSVIIASGAINPRLWFWYTAPTPPAELRETAWTKEEVESLLHYRRSDHEYSELIARELNAAPELSDDDMKILNHEWGGINGVDHAQELLDVRQRRGLSAEAVGKLVGMTGAGIRKYCMQPENSFWPLQRWERIWRAVL